MSDAIFRRQDGVWLNEPKRWTAEDDDLKIVTDKATDFWRETHCEWRHPTLSGRWHARPNETDYRSRSQAFT